MHPLLIPQPALALNESPSEKEGKSVDPNLIARVERPSMKVPPKRKGNSRLAFRAGRRACPLNESPSEKEGKFTRSMR